MTNRSETSVVRCPAVECGHAFDVPRSSLGRNVQCPRCGGRLTARPLDVERRLAERQREIAGGSGAPVERLPLAVLVDNVRSLWNVGSIFRTADGCGVERLILTGITGCPPRPQITKTALGADAVVRWDYRADAHEALAGLVAEGYSPVAVETSSVALPLDRIHWPDRVCLVIGNEVAGISPAALDLCARQVRIPMHGLKDSFNVAVAFGIVAHACSMALAARRPIVLEGRA